ncbi:hypothetical protein [Pseudogracilibacillus auburnensis]|nr:hypothetical protein [Pseudogracilibacillus auburnensis]MBO1004200.1 hypothetical protein [Pseudogracilibacillus auburnensis]
MEGKYLKVKHVKMQNNRMVIKTDNGNRQVNVIHGYSFGINYKQKGLVR